MEVLLPPCLLVGCFVCEQDYKKLQDRFTRNLVEEWDIREQRTFSILAENQIKGQTQDIFFKQLVFWHFHYFQRNDMVQLQRLYQPNTKIIIFAKWTDILRRHEIILYQCHDGRVWLSVFTLQNDPWHDTGQVQVGIRGQADLFRRIPQQRTLTTVHLKRQKDLDCVINSPTGS